MGLNTVILILNDHLGNIEDDPEFGRKLALSISAYGLRDWLDPRFRVISVAHADYTQIVATHGNIGAEVSSQLSPLCRKRIREAMDAALNGEDAK